MNNLVIFFLVIFGGLLVEPFFYPVMLRLFRLYWYLMLKLAIWRLKRDIRKIILNQQYGSVGYRGGRVEDFKPKL